MRLLLCLWLLAKLQCKEFVADAESYSDECDSTNRESCSLNILQRRARTSFSIQEHENERDAGAKAPLPISLIKGISYAPMPCKGSCQIHMDDFMDESSKPLWGPRGRADLQVIKALGANHIRLYGNSAEAAHDDFLDEAHSLGLSVIVGMSDYPYTQMQNNCLATCNCFEAVKALYLMNLLNGFMTKDKLYHPALAQLILVNEPDLKLPGIAEPARFVKAIISALDGILDAEQEAGVTGPLVNLTATFSFAICSSCGNFAHDPALGQMYALEQAILYPESVGYTPKHDLRHAYRARWLHSFNTAAPASFVKTSFLDQYEDAFASTPVVIQEYHAPGSDVAADLRSILEIAAASSLFRGVSFFEFQVRYDKGGSEMAFGLFGLGDFKLETFDYHGGDFPSWCLVPAASRFGPLPRQVAEAFGGEGAAEACVPNPWKVALTGPGLASIAAQGDTAVAVFLGRVAQHLGLEVAESQLQSLATHVLHLDRRTADFTGLVEKLSKAPRKRELRCVADRLSDSVRLAKAVSHACSKMESFNCSLMPPICNGSVWARADLVFSEYYKEKGGDPLLNCYFDGNALLAGSEYKGRRCGMQCCDRTGESPMMPTVAPTLPPLFGTPAPLAPESRVEAGQGSHKQVGDCSFSVLPVTPVFWDTTCDPSGGVGCMADGKHQACRFCGKAPFPSCP